MVAGSFYKFAHSEKLGFGGAGLYVDFFLEMTGYRDRTGQWYDRRTNGSGRRIGGTTILY